MKIINAFWGSEQTQKPKRIEKLKKNILKKATKNIQTVNFLILSDREERKSPWIIGILPTKLKEAERPDLD